MASSKEEQIATEDEQSLGACAVDCPKCTICMTPVTDENNKCQTCLEKMKSTPTGFQFEVDGPDHKMFECPICLCIMRKATELPCEHLMCHDCLFHYEEGQKEKAKRDDEGERALFYCSICQTAYDPNKKYHVKSTDRMIQTSLPIKCLEKDCNWVGCIQDFQEHEMKCDFLIIPCPCAEIGCFAKVKRRELQTHMVSEKSTHDILVLKSLSLFSQERVKYQQMIDTQSQQITDLQKTVKQNAKDIETVTKTNIAMKTKIDAQSKAIATNEKKIEVLLRENLALSGRIDAENLRVDQAYGKLTNIEKERATMSKELKSEKKIGEILTNDIAKLKTSVENSLANEMDMKDKQEKQSKDLTDLKLFAYEFSKLQRWLTLPEIHELFHKIYFIKDEDYNESEIAQSWKGFFDTLGLDNTHGDCKYLKNLSKVVSQYQDMIFHREWKWRICRMFHLMDSGVFLDKYIKFFSFGAKTIRVLLYDNQYHFDRVTMESGWCKYENDSASNVSLYSPDLAVALWHPSGCKNVWALHIFDETKKKKIEGETELDDDYFEDNYVILEVEWNAQDGDDSR